MRQTVAQLLLMLSVLSLASCSMEKRMYSKGYHISWLHPIPKNIEIVASQDVSQDASQELSQNLRKDLSSHLSQNLETDVSLDLSSNLAQNLETDVSLFLSKNLKAETLSDTITPNTKQDDYFGQKDYTSTKDKSKKPQDIRELKKETKDDFKVALLGLVGWAVSLGLLSVNNWSTLDSIKSAVFLIILGVLCALLFIIYFPIAIFRIFKLIFLKICGKPDDFKINQPKSE